MKEELEINITEEEEARRGLRLVEMLNLKEAKHGNSPRSLKSYDPPRYFTQWGTKTALGLFRSVHAVINGQ